MALSLLAEMRLDFGMREQEVVDELDSLCCVAGCGWGKGTSNEGRTLEQIRDEWNIYNATLG